MTTDVYTAVYLRVDSAESPLCYSAAYEEAVDDVKARVEAIKSEREEARRQGILDDASSQIDSAEKDARQLGDAAAQLDDAQAQLDSGAAGSRTVAPSLTPSPQTPPRSLTRHRPSSMPAARALSPTNGRSRTV